MQEKQSETRLEDSFEAFAARYPFPFDPFQYEAMKHLRENRSVLVAAPTGTGKTVVAEYAIWRALQRGQRVIYTTPLKALSNQKYRDLSAQYGSDTVGLLTGDIVEHSRALCLIMTTEIYRNMLLEEGRKIVLSEDDVARPTALEDIGVIIFDELHYLSDPQRGPVWEEAIICSPPSIQMVGLSATVSNAGQLAKWISLVHRPMSLIVHTQRAIPLDHYYLLDGQLYLVQDAQGRRQVYFPRIGGELRRALRSSPSRGRRRLVASEPEDDEQESFVEEARYETRMSQNSTRAQAHPRSTAYTSGGKDTRRKQRYEPPTAGEVLITLQNADLLPCLYFLPGRRLVEETAQEVAEHSFTTVEEQQHISELFGRWKEHLSPEDRKLPQVRTLEALLPRGIGFHHAGILPGLKVVVETLFANGMLRAVFATETLVLGVNMPARAVVLGSLSKFDGQRMRLLTPNEYQQLTGRAGRRGIDTHGAAVIPYSPWEPFEEAFGQITDKLLPVTSSFVIDYHAILNLWRPHDIETLEWLYASSLREYQRFEQRLKGEAQRRRKAARRRARTDQRQQRNTLEAGQLQEKQDERVNSLSLSASGAAELRGTIFVLQTLGYIGPNDHLTLKGELLLRLPHPAGMLLVELLLQGTLDRLAPQELAEVCSWLVFESDRRLNNRHILSAQLVKVREQLWQIEELVHSVEYQVGLNRASETRPDFHGVALCWAHGKTLQYLLERIDLAEGDVLMLLNETIDLLQQVQSAVGHVLDEHKHGDSALFRNGDVYRPGKRKRKGRKQEHIHASLTMIRPRLAQAASSLLHGIVLQSRIIPSPSVPAQKEELELAPEEDIDVVDMQAEEEEDVDTALDSMQLVDEFENSPNRED